MTCRFIWYILHYIIGDKSFIDHFAVPPACLNSSYDTAWMFYCMRGRVERSIQHETGSTNALLTSRPHPEYNKTHTMSMWYHNWFIVYCGLKATDKASVVDFLGIDLLGDEVSGWLGR